MKQIFMRKLIIVIILVIIAQSWTKGQSRYESNDGFISFFSSAPLEDIFAQNEKVKSLIDLSSKEIAFIVPIIDFEFEKSLMKTHFNDKYLESDKYPQATFEGKIYSTDNFTKNGEYKVSVEGNIKIHGVKKSIKVTGTVNISSNTVEIYSEFPLKLVDFKIKIPKIVVKNIAEEVLVKVNLKYIPTQ